MSASLRKKYDLFNYRSLFHLLLKNGAKLNMFTYLSKQWNFGAKELLLLFEIAIVSFTSNTVDQIVDWAFLSYRSYQENIPDEMWELLFKNGRFDILSNSIYDSNYENWKALCIKSFFVTCCLCSSKIPLLMKYVQKLPYYHKLLTSDSVLLSTLSIDDVLSCLFVSLREDDVDAFTLCLASLPQNMQPHVSLYAIGSQIKQHFVDNSKNFQSKLSVFRALSYLDETLYTHEQFFFWHQQQFVTIPFVDDRIFSILKSNANISRKVIDYCFTWVSFVELKTFAKRSLNFENFHLFEYLIEHHIRAFRPQIHTSNEQLYLKFKHCFLPNYQIELRLQNMKYFDSLYKTDSGIINLICTSMYFNSFEDRLSIFKYFLKRGNLKRSTKHAIAEWACRNSHHRILSALKKSGFDSFNPSHLKMCEGRTTSKVWLLHHLNKRQSK